MISDVNPWGSSQPGPVPGQSGQCGFSSALTINLPQSPPHAPSPLEPQCRLTDVGLSNELMRLVHLYKEFNQKLYPINLNSRIILVSGDPAGFQSTYAAAEEPPRVHGALHNPRLIINLFS